MLHYAALTKTSLNFRTHPSLMNKKEEDIYLQKLKKGTNIIKYSILQILLKDGDLNFKVSF